MKASVNDQRALLEVQALDRELTQHTAKRQRLESREALDALAAEVRGLTRERIETETAIKDSGRANERIEADLAQVRRRQEIQQGRLDRSEGSPKELAGLEEELVQIARRIAELEDDQYALLERDEALAARVDEIRDEVAAKEAEAEQLKAQAETQKEEADAAIAELMERRNALVAPLDADLVDLYDRVRQSTGGIGAVAVYGRRVEGMPIELSLAEAESLRQAAPDDVLQSEEYDVIYVRMPSN
ncbi:MAG: hypothetical protein E7A62_04070 [Actinomycetaceae bacterium]|nr:hypothetical protein [Actinomycetaceae bacterium]MDU0970162.1 hypothetical protein [Actinomycetaceae bacterium]